MNASGRFKRGLAFAAAGILATAVGVFLGCASGPPGQPHMRAALDELQGARGELERADSDKGGHRVEAIRLVDDAIAEVRSGMEFARRR